MQRYCALETVVYVVVFTVGFGVPSPGFADIPTEYGAVSLNTFLLRDRLVGNLKPDLDARAKIIPHRLAADSRVRLVLAQEVWTPGLRKQLAEEMYQLGFKYHATKNTISMVNGANSCERCLPLVLSPHS